MGNAAMYAGILSFGSRGEFAVGTVMTITLAGSVLETGGGDGTLST